MSSVLAAEVPPPAVAAPSSGTLFRIIRDHLPMGLLLLLALGLRLFRLGDVPGQVIGDECWYVQDARVILGLPVSPDHLPHTASSNLDPNLEHPSLAKAIMAGGMQLMGNQEIGWRLPSVVLGVLAIWLVFRIVLQLGGSRWQALFAAFLLAFDNLSFIHGRVGMLEIYASTFGLLGTWLYFAEWIELAAIAFAIAGLCKITGLFGMGAIFLYEVLLSRPWRRPVAAGLTPRLVMVAFGVAAFLSGLGALDAYFTKFNTPFEHLSYMLHYHVGLTHHGRVTGGESTPLQWWFNSGSMDYLTWKVTENGATDDVLFRAEMNLCLIAVAPLAILHCLQVTWSQPSRLAAFATASFAAHYGTIFLLWLILSRTSYIYYMVASMPGIACAVAVAAWALRPSFRWLFAVTVAGAFVVTFPFRYY